jgi:integrase
VYDYVNEFCGWEALAELNKYAGSPRNELYLLGLQKSGGRAGEVLALNTNNFSVNKRKKALIVSNMKLEKRFRTIKQPDGSKIRQHIEAIRKPFPIPIREPLSKELIEHLANTPDGYLFSSPYKSHIPLTVSWGYKLIIKINGEIPSTLFNQLGLNLPFMDKLTGQRIANTIHLWQHFFRAQRASQLRSEYGFTEADLMEYFGWLDYGTALHYSRLGASRLADKMNRKL